MCGRPRDGRGERGGIPDVADRAPRDRANAREIMQVGVGVGRQGEAVNLRAHFV